MSQVLAGVPGWQFSASIAFAGDPQLACAAGATSSGARTRAPSATSTLSRPASYNPLCDLMSRCKGSVLLLPLAVRPRRRRSVSRHVITTAASRRQALSPYAGLARPITDNASAQAYMEVPEDEVGCLGVLRR